MHPRAKAKYLAELVEGGRRCAKPAQCRRCGQDVLTGEDHDTAATTVTVDIEPVDQHTEMLAAFAGRHAFDLCPATGKTAKPGTFHLFHREPHHVAAAHQHPVLLEHLCQKDTAA